MPLHQDHVDQEDQEEPRLRIQEGLEFRVIGSILGLYRNNGKEKETTI